ncbi:hypothetical protein VCHENC02_5214, partial [Vibrio harveyi]
LKSTI